MLPDDKGQILAFCVLLDFVIDCFNFLTNTHFYNKFFLNRNVLFDDKVVSFRKNEYGSLV